MITAPVMSAPPRSASAGFDPTDVPNADPAHLMHMLAVLIRNGDGLVVLREPDPRAMKAVEAEFWADFSGDTATGVATVIRFRALIEVFAARRLRSLLLREGLVVLQAAFRVAAGLRLNSARGFNPQGLVWAVTADPRRGLPRSGIEKCDRAVAGGQPKRNHECDSRPDHVAA